MHGDILIELMGSGFGISFSSVMSVATPREESVTSQASPGNIGPVVESKSLEKGAAFSPFQANSEQLGDRYIHSIKWDQEHLLQLL